MDSDLEIWQYGVIRQNVLKPYNTALHSNVMQHYNDQEVEYCIRKKKQSPTQESHNYYRGIILGVCEQAEIFGGWKRDKIHRFFASMFLKDVEVKEIKGKTYMVESILSTGAISKKRMVQFIEEVRAWLDMQGIITPEPQKQQPNANKKNI